MVRTVAQENAQPLIALTKCSIVLDGKPVLNEATFALRSGERWAIVGPNGSGKTLLLKLLRGDYWPTPTGQELREYFFNAEASEQPSGVKEFIAYVGPEHQDKYVRYEWNYTVMQVVTTGLFDEDIPRTQASATQRQQVTRLLRHFGLWSLRRRRFLTLSYGQRRRALVARAFAAQPQVLLLDEVFNGLDIASARIIRKALQRTRGVGSTWIVTTHRRHDVPSNVTNLARMEKGRVVQSSTPTPSPVVKENRGEGDTERSLPIKNPSPQPVEGDFLSDPSQCRPALALARCNDTLSVVAEPSSTRPSRGEGAETKPLIQLRNVDLYRNYRLVLRDVNWTVARGEHWGIVGRNGSGKSTLLKLLYGDLHPRLGGTIERDKVPFGTPIAEWKQRVGYVSPELQADYFLARDLQEVVMSGRYSSIGLNDAPTDADLRAARRWIKFFGLAAIAHRRPRAVSYGQMRLALLARAMINKPELLLLDEPCTGLDPDMRAMVLKLLGRLAKQGVQLVMAVHEWNDLPPCVERMLVIGRDHRVAQQKR